MKKVEAERKKKRKGNEKELLGGLESLRKEKVKNKEQ